MLSLSLTLMCVMEKMLASCMVPPCRNAMHRPCAAQRSAERTHALTHSLSHTGHTQMLHTLQHARTLGLPP